jgi:thiamine-monophosphate kinase
VRAIDEHDLIARYFGPLAADPAALELTDDAAVLAPPAGCDLVLTKDGIAEGVHFPAGESGADVARKALRVNLSDLAAMGADQLGYLVLLGLPADWTEAWVASFADGLSEDQATYGVALYGGDTIRTQALTVSVTAIGSVPSGRAIRRAGARAGDMIYVSGTIGDGALGLLARRGALAGTDAAQRAFLAERYRAPQPRCALAPVLRRFARAAIDISDGLAGDLDKVCRASGVPARVDCEKVPLSGAARAAVDADPALLELCMTGGDDYEILCAVASEDAGAFEAAAREAGVPVAPIGAFADGAGAAVFVDREGRETRFRHRSFSHTG